MYINLGHLTEEFLDELKIAKTEGAKDRSTLVLCQRHAEMITSDDSIATNAAYREKIFQRDDPEVKAKRLETEAARKLVNKADAKKAKDNLRDVAAAKREADKATERARVALLPPAERKEYADAQKKKGADQKESNRNTKRL